VALAALTGKVAVGASVTALAVSVTRVIEAGIAPRPTNNVTLAAPKGYEGFAESGKRFDLITGCKVPRS
jgi:hypothetical protein